MGNAPHTDTDNWHFHAYVAPRRNRHGLTINYSMIDDWPPPTDDESSREKSASEDEASGRCACGNGAPLYAPPGSEGGDPCCARCWHRATLNTNFLEDGCWECGDREPKYDVRKPEHGKFYCSICFRSLTPTPKQLSNRRVRGAFVFRPDLPLLNAYVEFGWPASTPLNYLMGRVIAQEGDWLLVRTGPNSTETVHREHLIGTWFGPMSYASMQEAVLGAVDHDDDELLGAALVRLHRAATERGAEAQRRRDFDPGAEYRAPAPDSSNVPRLSPPAAHLTSPRASTPAPPMSKGDIRRRARALRKSEGITYAQARRQVVRDDTRQREAIASLETRLAEARAYIATEMVRIREEGWVNATTLPQQAFALGLMDGLSSVSCLVEHADESDASMLDHFSCATVPRCIYEHLVRLGVGV